MEHDYKNCPLKEQLNGFFKMSDMKDEENERMIQQMNKHLDEYKEDTNKRFDKLETKVDEVIKIINGIAPTILKWILIGVGTPILVGAIVLLIRQAING